MARGWESKSVESQIELAQERQSKAATPAKTPEQIALEEKRAELEFERTRVLHELEAATHPRHREMLQAGLRHLEDKLAALDQKL